MPLEIIRNDLTKVHADAIVNAANSKLLGGGGVDGAIHNAAGLELLEECKTLGGCEVGQAKITKGYNLPAKYVIHTAGPVWNDGNSNEEKLLENCYRNSLRLAKEYKLESIAFPLISSGSFGYPKDKALRTAISVIGEFLLENDMTVYIVVYDKAAFVLSEKLFSSITQFIDDKYVDEKSLRYNGTTARDVLYQLKEVQMEQSSPSTTRTSSRKRKRNLDELVNHVDETFTQMLLRLIDERGMTDSQAYNRANVDRRHFSKIRNDINYKPSKTTVFAFSIALKLSLDETRDLLNRAGFGLSRSSKFDIIIEYFIYEENYDIFEINEALYAFDQHLLGV